MYIRYNINRYYIRFLARQVATIDRLLSGSFGVGGTAGAHFDRRLRFSSCPCNPFVVGALILRIGFWGKLYYNHNKEPPRPYANY